jgi:hypothetical protein
LVPAGITLRSEEHGTLIIVHAVDFPAELGEMDADFGTNEAGGASDEEAHGGGEELLVIGYWGTGGGRKRISPPRRQVRQGGLEVIAEKR